MGEGIIASCIGAQIGYAGEELEQLVNRYASLNSRYEYENGYELLKEFSRGKRHTLQEYREFIESLQIEEKDKDILLKLTPQNYIGLAEKLCK